MTSWLRGQMKAEGVVIAGVAEELISAPGAVERAASTTFQSRLPSATLPGAAGR